MTKSDLLGTEPINKLIWQQAGPAAIGVLTLSLNSIIDAFLVGNYVGKLGIGAVTVVGPITFLIAAIGMSIGVGGASIISRALGANEEEKAQYTFGNQLTLTLSLAAIFVLLGLFFQDNLLMLFGGRGELLEPSKIYFNTLIYLAFAMMSNNVMRAIGRPKVAMAIMMVSAIVNIILDILFIAYLDMGLFGAALATSIAYVAASGVAIVFFMFADSEIKVSPKYLRLKIPIVQEIFAIGGVTLARQGTISSMQIILNNSLYAYGGAFAVAVWGIIQRMMMGVNFPVFGLVQGFLPIAGYNYGAKLYDRVSETIKKSILFGIIIACAIYLLIYIGADRIADFFTADADADIAEQAAFAMVIVFLANPLLVVQLIGSAYFQAIGKAKPALFLSLLKQGIFLIPLILILPRFFGLLGIWIAFPIADVLTALVNYIFLKRETNPLQREV